jgi:flagellar hook protein FlgE
VEAGEDGAGLLSTRTVERSNVDIATEFSKLILAQRAYSANTRIVTTVDELLQETLNMRR